MKDVFAAKKLSRALQLSLQSTRLALAACEACDSTLLIRCLWLGAGIDCEWWRAQEDESDEHFRSLVLDRPELLLERVRALEPKDVDEWRLEQLCCVMDDGDYDAAAAARESESGVFLDVHAVLMALRGQIQTDHESNRRLAPTASFAVAVDGSRQSYLAFELAARLRRQGKLSIVNVDDSQSANLQLPQIPPEFIREEYKAHCARLKLPPRRFSIGIVSDDSVSSLPLATQLLVIAERSSADFLVVGSVGKGGPAINQLGHVTRDVLATTTTLPVLVVPPAPINSTALKRYVFVVAVDTSQKGNRCLNAALKLMRPNDLLRVVHFYRKPVAGEFDDAGAMNYYREAVESVNVEAVVDLEAMDEGISTSEALQDYLAAHSAAYLIMGLSGSGHEEKTSSNTEVQEDSGVNFIGRVASAIMQSPRCATCLCP